MERKSSKIGSQSTNQPELFHAEHIYEVDRLLDYKKYGNGQEKVLVRWKGFSSKHNTWEPVSNLSANLLNNLNVLRQKNASTKTTEVIL